MEEDPGYPILPLKELDKLSREELLKNERDVVNLLRDLQRDEGTESEELVQYLRRQKAELGKLVAKMSAPRKSLVVCGGGSKKGKRITETKEELCLRLRQESQRSASVQRQKNMESRRRMREKLKKREELRAKWETKRMERTAKAEARLKTSIEGEQKGVANQVAEDNGEHSYENLMEALEEEAAANEAAEDKYLAAEVLGESQNEDEDEDVVDEHEDVDEDENEDEDEDENEDEKDGEHKDDSLKIEEKIDEETIMPQKNFDQVCQIGPEIEEKEEKELGDDVFDDAIELYLSDKIKGSESTDLSRGEVKSPEIDVSENEEIEVYNRLVKEHKEEIEESDLEHSFESNKEDKADNFLQMKSVEESQVFSKFFMTFGEIFTFWVADKSLKRQDRSRRLIEILEEITEEFKSASAHVDARKRYFHCVSKSRHEVFNIVRDACLNLDSIGVSKPLWDKTISGGKKSSVFSAMEPISESSGSVWNLLWTWTRPKIDRNRLLRWQCVNRFSTTRCLTRKDMLKEHLRRFQCINKAMATEFELLPDTFILPKEYVQFVNCFSKFDDMEAVSPNIWIMKPIGLSRGRGISLVGDISDVCYGESMVIQRYISNPLLLDGYKFDLRIYVLVTSFQPLEAFIYKEGFARMCTHKYSSASMDLKNLFIHLTNSSIQKLGPNGAGTMATAESISRHEAEIDEAGGTKLCLTYLWRRFESMGIDSERVQRSIEELILKSLVVCNESMQYEPNSFEIFGYDVLLDENLRPWLIEVNASPSLSQENQLDTRIKRKLIADTIRLVNPVKFDRNALLKVFEERLMELKGKKQQKCMRESERLQQELGAIFHGGYKPRVFGELPEELGLFKRLCPFEDCFERIQQNLAQISGKI